MELEDIKKLANLARIDMNDEEMEGIAKDFGGILAYVGQVQEAAKLISDNNGHIEKKPENYFLHNVVREDVVTNKQGEYADKIISEMPEKQDAYLKVKRIL